jgi:hypothetical protein
VRLTRCSTGLLVLIIGTGVFSWLFDDIFALIIFFALASLIFSRAFLFSRKISIVLSSLDIVRSAEKTIIRKGSNVAIRTSVTCRIPDGITVFVRDILPEVAQLVTGNNSVTSSDPGLQTVDFQYTIALLSTGHVGFRGINMEIRDPFFSSRFRFRNSQFQGPSIWVEPVGVFRKGKDSGLFGEWEGEKRSPLRGFGVVAFRDYITGDDPRSIDWKMTAKHGKIFVREYAGLCGVPSLFIVDFSGNSGELGNAWDRLAGSLLQAFKDTVRERQKCSLVLISGVNLITYLPDESSLSRVRSAIGQKNSYPQIEHAYRNLEAGPARYVQKRIEREEAESNGDSMKSLYLHNLWKIYDSFLPKMQPSIFDVQVARLMQKKETGRTYIFSLFQGDLSHIRTLIHQSRLRGIQVSCEVPEAVADPALVANLKAFGANDIQVIK